MFSIETYSEQLTDELTVAVTVGLEDRLGVELIIVEYKEPTKSIQHIVGFLSKVLNTYPPKVLEEQSNVVFYEASRSPEIKHLITEVLLCDWLKLFVKRAGLHEDVKVVQYHPPLYPMLTKEAMLEYFPGYFPLDTVTNIVNIDKNDYRLLIH